MRLQRYLNEKYLDTYKVEWIPGMSTPTDVFVNPSSKDMIDARKNVDSGQVDSSVRFIADNKNKKVYVWNAYQGLHADIWKKLSRDTSDSRKIYDTGELVLGVYHVKQNKVEFESRKYYSIQAWFKAKTTDWEWVDRYIKDMSKTFEKLSAVN